MANNFFGGMMSTERFRRRGIWVGVAILLIITAAFYFGVRGGSGPSQSAFPSTVAQPVGDLPNLPEKPRPQQISFDGCPPEGGGGDSELNLLRNRVDEGSYLPVSFDSLISLTWPKTIERREMKDWPPDGRAFIDQYAGIPILVEGYVVNVRESPPEATNCSRTGAGNLDWHIYFTKGPKDARSQAVIAETTPRVRLNHKWTLDLMHSAIIDNHLAVRISGWLFFDPDHPEEIGQTRATLWEIHPVMQIEVFENGRWIALDKFAK
jgi:hypothetical protein